MVVPLVLVEIIVKLLMHVGLDCEGQGSRKGECELQHFVVLGVSRDC